MEIVLLCECDFNECFIMPNETEKEHLPLGWCGEHLLMVLS